MRLSAGPAAGDGTLGAGIELHLGEGWKTYWLNPGPNGIPPRIDFTGSENLAKAEALWPAPARIADGDAEAAGYTGILVVPVTVTPKDPAKPVALKLHIDFGMCEKICVPASADLKLELVPGAKPQAMAAALIEGFKSRVPKPAKLGREGELAVTAIARTSESLGVSVRFPEKAKTRDLFARAEGVALPLPKLNSPGSYSIRLKPGSTPAKIELVAVADGEAIAVPIALDLPAAKP
ncbi:protein involved in C cytochrome biogenesis [Terrihabitans soli]|uniref:Protein involved in C cytochrome biogenesis n=2 Tax=Terrihabitans soli TaxID=708113 RepID=A0A6S6QIT1_9HYPH|nr:protein involved in C cytochrome biogenesis [Terrihabitans soli]